MRAGRVSTAVVGPVIGELIEERWPDDDEDGCQVLAEKIGCHPESIRKLVGQRYAGADFGFVDSILAGLGRPDLWMGRLADAYTVALPEPRPEPTLERIPALRCGHSTDRSNLNRSGVRDGVQEYRCRTCNTLYKRFWRLNHAA